MQPFWRVQMEQPHWRVEVIECIVQWPRQHSPRLETQHWPCAKRIRNRQPCGECDPPPLSDSFPFLVHAWNDITSRVGAQRKKPPRSGTAKSAAVHRKCHSGTPPGVQPRAGTI